jgi:hypothetical protein
MLIVIKGKTKKKAKEETKEYRKEVGLLFF